MLECAIKERLDSIVGPIHVSPLFVTSIPGIVYTVTPISGGLVKSSQVEVKVIHGDYDEALAIREIILKDLDLEQNKPSLVNSGISFRPELAGGGSIYSEGPQAWEISLILIITWRCL